LGGSWRAERRRLAHQGSGAQLLGSPTVEDRDVGRRATGIDHDGYPAADLVQDAPNELVALRLGELQDLAGHRDPYPVHARAEIEVDESADALIVDPPTVVEWRDQNRIDAGHSHVFHG